MSRYAAYGNRETPWELDGDPAFRGVDMLHERGLVQPGYLARAENKRLRDGVAKTRLGTTLPGDFNPTFEEAICGALVYNNPNGAEVMLVATTGANYVWALQFARDPIQIPLETPQTIGNYQVEFVQAFDKVLLLRRPILLPTLLGDTSIGTCTFATDGTGDITVGAAHGLTAGKLVRFTTSGTLPAAIALTTNYFVLSAGLTTTKLRISLTAGGSAILFAGAGTGTHTIWLVTPPPAGSVPTLEWDGNFDTTTHIFKPVTLIAPGLNLVPATWNGEPFGNRVIYYAALYPLLPWRDQLLVSNVLNYTAYLDPTAAFRINAGESNMITRVMGYFRSSLVIFMKQSIHMLSNFQLDFAQAQQRMLSSRGSVGNKMPLQDGSDIIFLSQDGFYRLGEVIQDQIAVEPTPISRNIQPLIEQIDWDRAYNWACSAALGDYAYFALPLLDSYGANDCLAVYNRTQREWESVDNWANPNFRIHSLHTTLYNGTRKLFMVGEAGGTFNIYLYGSGLEDEIVGNSLPVQDLLETRGYNLRQPASFKRFERAIIGLSTYDPEAQITALSDGVNEEKELSVVTKDRNRSYLHGRGDFNPDTDDPNTPKREDYSLVPAVDFAGEDFELYNEGPITFLAGTPVAFNGVKQQSLERFQIRQNGRWVSIRIANTNGQCDVVSVAVEGIGTQEAIKVVA